MDSCRNRDIAARWWLHIFCCHGLPMHLMLSNVFLPFYMCLPCLLNAGNIYFTYLCCRCQINPYSKCIQILFLLKMQMYEVNWLYIAKVLCRDDQCTDHLTISLFDIKWYPNCSAISDYGFILRKRCICFGLWVPGKWSLFTLSWHHYHRHHHPHPHQFIILLVFGSQASGLSSSLDSREPPVVPVPREGGIRGGGGGERRGGGEGGGGGGKGGGGDRQ